MRNRKSKHSINETAFVGNKEISGVLVQDAIDGNMACDIIQLHHISKNDIVTLS